MIHTNTNTNTNTNRLYPYVSVVIPAHNEIASVANAVKEIQRVLEDCNVQFELIIVDDGSNDGTFDRVREVAADNQAVRGIQLSRNFGKESALMAGLEASAGDVVITIDADMQHPPAVIPEMLDLWRQGHKIVHAVKHRRVHDSFVARFRAAVFNNILTKLGGVDVRNSSDFKLLDRVVVDVISNELPERRRFYRGLAGWVGFKQTSIPFSVSERIVGEGKWSIFALADLAITAIVSFTSAPLRIVTLLGLITLVFGILLAVYTLWGWSHGRAVSGFATIILTLLIIGSSIMISLGIVGEYIAKIYEEIKSRPLYLVQSRCGFNNKDKQE